MSVSAGQPVIVSRRIEAVPEVVFALLADPAMHPVLDGSGMVRESVSTAAISQVGDTFTKFELRPLGTNATEVTESYDCTRSPEWLRRAVKKGERWRESIALTLDKLDRAATSKSS